MMTTRRIFLQLSSGALAGSLIGCGGGGDDNPVVDTTSGKFSGTVQGGTAVYKGIPYAQPPVGALRFQSPKPYVPITAQVTPATAFGPASLQTLPANVTWIYTQPIAQSEDCLTLNVWAPRDMGKAPVVVWLHGGAWRTGATSMPLMDGQKLAEQGLVVVTVNYRLGAMSSLAHPDFTDPETGLAANWGLQDQAAALRWVHENIARFGGDPGNVCLAGQSAGAVNTALIAQHPVWSQWLHKAVLFSSAGIAAPAGFTLQDAASYTELLATSLKTTPKGLLSIPAATLHAAEVALNAQPLPATFRSGFGVKASPVMDGKTVFADWTRVGWPQRVPVLITNTLTEGSFFVDLVDPATQTSLTTPLPSSMEALAALVAPISGSASRAAQVIGAYQDAAVAEGRSSAPGNLWVEINGDRNLRNFCVRYADSLVKQGANVRYGTFMHDLPAPGRGVPHCAELPFLFGTYGLDYYRQKVGSGSAEQQLSRHLMSAVVTFAQSGTATFADGTVWQGYGSGNTNSALIGAGASSSIAFGTVPKIAQMRVWDALLGYQ
jgi:para-nitrobenzyl esterase